MDAERLRLSCGHPASAGLQKETENHRERGMHMTPYLYTIVEKQRLSDMLKAFYCCVELPIPGRRNGRWIWEKPIFFPAMQT